VTDLLLGTFQYRSRYDNSLGLGTHLTGARRFTYNIEAMRRARFTTRLLALTLALLLANPGWGATPTITPELPNPGSPGMTKEQQIQLGQQVVAEVYKQMPVLPDSDPVSQYVQQLGKKLVSVIPQQYSWPYQFHVIPQKEINAFALPGGPIFINIGTINAADNEAELAGVIAHEMSHVYMQHSAKQAPKQEWAGLLGALGGLLGGGLGRLAQMGIQMGAGTLLMRYSRKDEAQADAVGAIIMYKAGYNPKAMAEFFQKLETQGGGGGPQFLSDHPNPGNRVQAVEKEIANWRPKDYITNSPAFVQVKQLASKVSAYSAQEIADGAKRGEWARRNRESGAMRDLPVGAGTEAAAGTISDVSYQQIRPSENFTRLEQNAFSISYPANWRAYGGRDSTVTIAPQAGVTQGAIAYGVVIAPIPDRNYGSLEQATEDLVQTLQQSNPGLTKRGNAQRMTVAGQLGMSVELMGTSPIQRNGQPEPERDWLVTVECPQGGAMSLLFIAPEDDFAQLRPTYQKMLESLQLK
jgi:Peptidase family M48